jgi:hypothetical protein
MQTCAHVPQQFPEWESAMKTIKTLTLSAALAAVFLSAGAFAHVTMPVQHFVAHTSKANVTVIRKNSEWPKIIRLTACDLRRCVEA